MREECTNTAIPDVIKPLNSDSAGHGCLVTALDRRAIDRAKLATTPEQKRRLNCVKGDLTSESSISAAFESANRTFGPPSILIANAGITDESAHPPIWEIKTEIWDKVNSVNVRGTFLTIKYFLLSVKSYQEEEQVELENVSIIVTGSETGKFGQEGHAEYASGKAGLQYGLVKGVKNEIVRLNSTARINAVAPGWVATPLIGDRLDDPKEMWAECQATYVRTKAWNTLVQFPWFLVHCKWQNSSSLPPLAKWLSVTSKSL